MRKNKGKTSFPERYRKIFAIKRCDILYRALQGGELSSIERIFVAVILITLRHIQCNQWFSAIAVLCSSFMNSKKTKSYSRVKWKRALSTKLYLHSRQTSTCSCDRHRVRQADEINISRWRIKHECFVCALENFQRSFFPSNNFSTSMT